MLLSRAQNKVSTSSSGGQEVLIISALTILSIQ